MAYNRDRAPKEDNAPEFIEKVVYLNRVSKTVKGGRVMKFSALVVVGDGKGTVGYGLGKAAEVSEAILKGIADAKKNMVKITLDGTTIPHDVIGIYGAGKVMLKPAPVGTGIIAGGAVRAVMEAVGISNIRAKCLRSNNPQNVVKATMQGLMSSARCGGSRPYPRQERGRNRRLRRTLKWRILELSWSRASTAVLRSTF